MLKKSLYIILVFFLLADIGFTFVQNLQIPLDGDITGGVIPDSINNKIFEDPFGIKVITEDAHYPNPNRFFIHWIFSNYFSSVPFLLQEIIPPIESIYFSSAIAKTCIQIALIVLLGKYITKGKKTFGFDSILAMALVTPLFQTNGYRSYMGIIDHSITYTFFYSLPLVLLAIFLYPFFKNLNNGTISHYFVIIPLMIILPFSGPLIPGILLIIALLLFINASIYLNNISTIKIFIFITLSFLSLYSLYLNTHNSIFDGETLPIIERYTRLPRGIFYLVSQKIGFPILIAFTLVNIYIIKKYFLAEGKPFISIFKWIGIFSILFILLLPLGGYKEYRPYILRYDTIIPVTICLIFMYGLSSYFLIKRINHIAYKIAVIIFTLIFTFSDKLELHKNLCEKQEMEYLKQSDFSPVPLNGNCTLMSWKKIEKPEDSKPISDLLFFWGVIEEKKLFYQR
jgi:hypothetical protein